MIVVDKLGIGLVVLSGTRVSIPHIAITCPGRRLHGDGLAAIYMPGSTHFKAKNMINELGDVAGLRDEGAAGVELQKVTVFINGMEVEVPARPFDVRGTFGDEAVLIHYYSGQPVMTNEWGLTLHPLQNGALYYVVRPSTSSDTDLVFNLTSIVVAVIILAGHIMNYC